MNKIIYYDSPIKENKNNIIGTYGDFQADREQLAERLYIHYFLGKINIVPENKKCSVKEIKKLLWDKLVKNYIHQNIDEVNYPHLTPLAFEVEACKSLS